MKKTVMLFLTLVLLASLVAVPVLADEPEPGPPPPDRERTVGKVIEIDDAAASFTVQPRFGDPVLVLTSDETEYFLKVNRGGLEPIGFDDLKVEDIVHVDGVPLQGVINATKVVIFPPEPLPIVWIHGFITAIDPAAGTFTLERRPPEQDVETPDDASLVPPDPVTVQTSNETEYYLMSHHGVVQPIRFDDLQLRDRVQVAGNWSGELIFDAVQVIVRPQEPPPPPPPPVQGIIMALDPETRVIGVETRLGDHPIRVFTTNSTLFIQQGSHSVSYPITYEDLKLRDRVKIDVTRVDGKIVARRVTVMKTGPKVPEEF